MSGLVRWEPMRDMMSLREAMDQLFNDAFTRPVGKFIGAVVPDIDLYQDDAAVVVKAALPGVKPEDVQISVTDDVLTLRGEFKQDEEKKGAAYHIREHRQGSFERSVVLPIGVQTDKANADFENGVLTITLPKAETVKPKTITINTMNGKS